MLVTAYGGSLSGEHGDGQARGSLLPIMFGNEIMQAFREFKALWDPMGRMNPGKWSMHTRSMRTCGGERTTHRGNPPHISRSPGSRPLLLCSQSMRRYRQVPQARQRHHVPELHGDARRASLDPGASSAPVRDAGGQPARSGWRDTAVKEALDLCLACKGCRAECPVNVDMATYKAEFLSHYFEAPPAAVCLRVRSDVLVGRRRSTDARTFQRGGADAGLSAIAKALVGMAPERRIPQLASQTFRAWFGAGRGAARPSARHPVAGYVEQPLPSADCPSGRHVLEAAGFRVMLPGRPLCCGRPLYDYGMLDLARRQLRQTIRTLRARRFDQASASWGWSRVVSRCFEMRPSISCMATRTRHVCRVRPIS